MPPRQPFPHDKTVGLNLCPRSDEFSIRMPEVSEDDFYEKEWKVKRWKIMKFHFRILASIFATALIFTIVVVSFSEGLKWPVSLPTLGVVLGVAWLVGGVAGEVIARTKWPAVVVTMLSVGLALSTLGFGVPWRLEEPGVDTGENVWFRMEASFTYRGSKENLPIENVAIRFPCPNIENEALKVIAPTPSWLLYYVENDNTLTLQATSEQVYGFCGERTRTLEILLSGVEPTPHGPKLYFRLDKLYPREVFQAIALSQVSEKNADKVTLGVYGDNEGRSSAYYIYPSGASTIGDPIDISFTAQLKKVDDNYKIVETFSRSVDNANVGWMWWLYPS